MLERLQLDRDVADALRERADLERADSTCARSDASFAASRDPLTERGDLGVDGLLLLDDRVRARRRSSENGEHEHESRTADHAASFAGRGATPPALLLQRLHRPGSLGPQRRDESAVVLVRDLAGAVVELELLQRIERTVSLLDERQPLPPALVQRPSLSSAAATAGSRRNGRAT